MVNHRAFWLDEQFDREHAEDGQSRYGEYVRRRLDEFKDAWGDFAPVRFAATSWLLATALSPGFVRWHRRIVAASCHRNDWDGSLICTVSVVSPWPAELTWTRQWERERGFRDWPRLFGQYVSPSEQDLSRSPHLRAMLFVEAPVPMDDLPPAPDGPVGDWDVAARRAVTVLVRELNELIGPLIGQLESGVPVDRG